MRQKNIDSFPHLLLVKASAGAGKTYSLTKRFVEFLLNEKIPSNKAKNIMALTFANSAVQEMKERILIWLKNIYLQEKNALAEFQELNKSPEELKSMAENLIDELLANYSEFQVRTIDSFMTKVFKSTALEFGYNPEFDILMSNRQFLKRAFELFLSRVNEELIEVVDEISKNKTSSKFIWNPAKKIFNELEELYFKFSHAEIDISRKILDDIEEKRKKLTSAEIELKTRAENFEKALYESGKELRKNSKILEIINKIKNGQYTAVFETKAQKNPVTKPDEKLKILWEIFIDAILKYAEIYSEVYYYPYLKVFYSFIEILELLKRKEDTVFIEDINKYLSKYINLEIVPEIYFKLGQRIHHYFIDEFQDTSQLQWKNIYPLVENALSEGGSLYIVGDTKQAIYGFRGADYRIMQNLISDIDNDRNDHFPSASSNKRIFEIEQNWRSAEKIIEFNKKLFQELIEQDEILGESAKLSGLNVWKQKPIEKHCQAGYVEIIKIEKDKNFEQQKKEEVLLAIKRLQNQGFELKDIAILAFKNQTVIDISGWLNEEKIDFISYSSLDIRNRKIIGEIVSLIKFLDSPIDDLAFAEFILGEIASQSFSSNNGKTSLGTELQNEWHNIANKMIIEARVNSSNRHLYKVFQEKFPNIWEEYFSTLFKKAGYLPFYDLLTDIYCVFNLFEKFPHERASLVKLLEIVNSLEKYGKGIKDFLELYKNKNEDDRFWEINMPEGIEAIKLMTVHTAKGLEFPATIVIFDLSYKSQNMIFHEGRLLRLTEKIASKSQNLNEIYLEKKRENLADDLNKIYVALTRAKEAVVLIVPISENIHPFARILPFDDYQSKEYSRKIPKKTEENNYSDFHLEKFYPLAYEQVYPEQEIIVNIEEIKKGEFIHKILSFIDYLDENTERKIVDAVKNLNRVSGTDYDPEEIRNLILSFISLPEISQFFLPSEGRTVMNEKEFVKDGQLYRMDRVVVDPNTITLIDYKLEHFQSKHEKQIKHYLQILKDLYPDHKLRGFLCYIHHGRIVSLQ